MPAYVIADVTVNDPDRYGEYTSQVLATVEPFGGRFTVRGGAPESVEDWPASRIVVIEFPSRQAATDWYHSPEYQAIVGIRHEAATARIVVVDGA